MKKILFAVLLLCPSFAAAEPASLANRINITLNLSQEDTRGSLEKTIKDNSKDQDASAGLSVGYNFSDMFEVGVTVNILAAYGYKDTDNHDVSYYNAGIYAKILAPQLSLSNDTGLGIFAKIGAGQYFYDDTWKTGHTTHTTSYDYSGMFIGGGADINFPNWIIGLEYQLHRVHYETYAQNIGLNVGYRF